jgi:radical SAM-linked protein
MSERPSEKAQRLRLRFGRGPEAASVGHLELSRLWERALLAAGCAISYSQSNRPQPRLTIAAGLPQGVTSDGELLDVILAEPAQPSNVVRGVPAHLPPGIELFGVEEVGMGLPSLPNAVRWADYEVDVLANMDLQPAIDTLLARESLPWEDTRGEKVRHYDLRPLIAQLRIECVRDDHARVVMRLKCGADGVGRPDQVAKALGLPQPERIHRLRLIVADSSPAREAWRRRGRFVE